MSGVSVNGTVVLYVWSDPSVVPPRPSPTKGARETDGVWCRTGTERWDWNRGVGYVHTHRHTRESVLDTPEPTQGVGETWSPPYPKDHTRIRGPVSRQVERGWPLSLSECRTGDNCGCETLLFSSLGSYTVHEMSVQRSNLNLPIFSFV